MSNSAEVVRTDIDPQLVKAHVYLNWVAAMSRARPKMQKRLVGLMPELFPQLDPDAVRLMYQRALNGDPFNFSPFMQRGEKLRKPGQHLQFSVYGCPDGLLHVGPTALELTHNDPMENLDKTYPRPDPIENPGVGCLMGGSLFSF